MMKNKSTKMRVFLLVTLMVVCNTLILGRIWSNGGGKGYCDPGSDQECSNGQGNSTINALIEEGAGYFLKANSIFLTFLNRMNNSDLSAFDFIEEAQRVDNALENIKNAKMAFEKIVREAENTPYNETFISKLKVFDYHGFMTKNNLDPAVFNELSEILKSGDLTGYLKRVYSKIAGIEESIMPIKNELSSKIMPGMEKVWEANERFQMTQLFGTYAAQVFLKEL